MATGPIPTDFIPAARVFVVGLKELIGGRGNMRACGEAEEGATAFRAITPPLPDIVLVRIALPGNSDLALIESPPRLP